MANAMDYVRSSNGQPPSNEGDLQKWLDEMADMGKDRIANYSTYDEFYRGTNQRTYLTDRTKRFLERAGIKWRENFCETIVDVQAERMIVIGFSHEDEKINEWCEETWTANRMDAKQQVIHTNALVKGDAFLMLDWDADEARPCIHYNRSDMIKCVYSNTDPDEMLYAVKVWIDDGKQMMNIYYEDRIEKYYRLHENAGRGGWVQRIDEADYDDKEGEEPAPRVWPVPWVDEKGEPLGIPVFHFRNRALGEHDGFSELDNVIPEQESMNKQVIDLNQILDYAAWKQRYAVGMTVEEVGALKTGPGDVWVNPNPDGKFGEFDADDPQGIIAAIENTLSRMARRSRTPLHLLTGGDMPSGEALRSAEAGLVKKVEACQVPFGNVWEDVMVAAMRLSVANGVDIGFEIPTTLDTEWKDPQSRNELESLQAAILKQQLGVSQATLLQEMGYNAEDEAKAKQAEDEAKMEMQAKMFDAGLGGGGDLFGQDQRPNDKGQNAKDKKAQAQEDAKRKQTK